MTMPSGIVAMTPMMAASRNGKWAAAASRPATHAPKPAMVNWASESWPV